MMLDGYALMHPYWLFLLAGIPLLIWWERRRETSLFRIGVPSTTHLAKHTGWRAKAYRLVPLLKYLGLALLIMAMSRPRKMLKEEIVKAEGIDIFLVMDLSSSMLARDFDPDRLEVSKSVAIDFVEKRSYDRFGLAVFAGESYTQSPLTTDHRVIKDFLASLQCGILEDGTAIGMGLAAAINRLKDSEAESKVVILLTDGVNNAGYINPMTAAEIAKEFNVRVYTIGVGSRGEALAPMSRRDDGRYIFGMARVQIDERLLTDIAELTGGKYYRATSEEGLKQVYDEIDLLEKTEIDVTAFKRYSEEYAIWLMWGLGMISLSLLLNFTVLRALPD